MTRPICLLAGLVFIAGASSAICAREIRGAQLLKVSAVSGSTIILNGNSISDAIAINSGDVAIDNISGETRTSIKREDGKYFILDVTCNRLLSSGKLKDCSAPISNPADGITGSAASALVRGLRLSTPVSLKDRNRIVAVSLTIKVSNSLTEPVTGPCIGCVPIPPPPLPPPSMPPHN